MDLRNTDMNNSDSGHAGPSTSKRYFEELYIDEESTPIKKRKLCIRDTIDDDDDDDDDAHEKKSATQDQRSKKFHLDLSEDVEKVKYHQFSVNLGKNTIVELKEFHNSYYIGFSRINPDTKEPKNRFNMPLNLLNNLKIACGALSKHIAKK